MHKYKFPVAILFAILSVILFSCQHQTTVEDIKNKYLDSFKHAYYGKLITTDISNSKTGASPATGVPAYGDEQLSFISFKVYGILSDSLRFVDTSIVIPSYILVEDPHTDQRGWLHHKYISEYRNIDLWGDDE